MIEYDYDPGARQRGDASMFRKPLWPWLLAAIIIVAVLLAIGHAYAQAPPQPCAPRALIIKHLADKYHESVKDAMIITADGLEGGQPVGVLEITVSDSGSWTMFITDPSTGLSCLEHGGGHFETEAPKPKGKPA